MLEHVRLAYEKRTGSGEVDPGLVKLYLSEFTYGPGSDLAEMRSLLVFSLPEPAIHIRFTLPDGPLVAVVPPVYVRLGQPNGPIRQQLEAGPFRDRNLAPLSAPVKLLAATLGLVDYGRNNITSSPAAGTYHRLACLATDEDLVEDPANVASGAAGGHPGPRLAPECEGCEECREACPTGAIPADRFLLHAERCLSYATELPGDDWPDWVPPSAHNCLIGCMRCQEVCPRNRGRLSFLDFEPAFDTGETLRLLGSEAEIPASAAEIHQAGPPGPCRSPGAPAEAAGTSWGALKAETGGLDFVRGFLAGRRAVSGRAEGAQ